MNFSLDKSIEILERTPAVIAALTTGLSPEWTDSNEGADTWNVFDVVGHLVHGDRTDWIVRAELILSDSDNKAFSQFDRFAQFENSKGKTLLQLLDEFKTVRTASIDRLRKLQITGDDLAKTGLHPTFGRVSLSQLLSTWVVHDLDHIAQISRIMAKQYKEQTGPWIEFLKILRQ
ncbi:hypothetical protein BH11BAC5_BH11BAC5_15210 [soil metagenome]